VPVDLLQLYTRGQELLVGLRRGGFAADEWDTPSGKLEPGETLQHGMAREAFEEIGLRLPAEQLRVAAMTHWYPPDGVPRVGCSSTSRLTRLATASRTSPNPPNAASSGGRPLVELCHTALTCTNTAGLDVVPQ
jgi:8-oxo-dGTP pyrophosphatase MutT (NUDIX family)